ncbi:6,7-dimethyl-8-ribityllumazine synthase [Trichophyton rubrum D6]|uniref:6,7-dimethyl-8-ribityllumazine synthase n=5 Tax=Trichophyton TaxID=5550 RepID=A0A178F2F1_TRIRU|nr:6,7-dimethyl-8-ribityllumazine synthase [Trichophyton rubrum CBS 118892]EZF13156.1 6,7-dimethyl-8-ribityllumazine synthase [Trichophyton rubrum MR850]EZF39686.1 6,7-dimethyl-8-ribityllumazine synthase [Trichophyton rubrum CBS 100081]EZF50210.1 6,7-dimethyl-8-ribityllumazine synthase [Trichophyton rubrum CBS 288.86]EZF60842.1 6,7-dimethyl-8-ribityllumazine synthase [Trichophyton rubrum CBS 289.86]EZF71360.1 6,7-dimethyl-8-ribityllumazine synthase [Trichophyton soudanense CBS 452.61]EZF82169
MSTVKGPGAAQTVDGSNLRIAIVHARWNWKIIEALVAGAKKSILAAGVKEENIVVQSVPGSYELPFGVKSVYEASQAQSTSNTAAAGCLGAAKPFDAIVAIGALIKGETMHFEYIADAVSHGLMRLQLDMGVPVIFGVLTVLNDEQGLARAGLCEGGKSHNHGEDWGSAAVEMGFKRKGALNGQIL